MTKKQGIALIVTGGFLSGFIGLSVATVLFLRSPEGSKYILSYVQEALQQKAQIKFEYQSASLDLLSKIHIEGLHLSRPSASEPIEIRAKSIDLHYQIFFFARALKVERLWMNDLNLNVKIKSPHSDLETQFNHVNAELQLQWVPNHLVFSGELQTQEPGRIWTVSSNLNTSEKMEILAIPFASGKWAGEIRQINSEWIYELQPSHFNLGLKQLEVKQTTKDTALNFRLSDMNFESQGKMLAQSKELFQIEPTQSLKSAELDGTLSAKRVDYEATQQGKTQKVHLTSQKAQMNLHLAEELGVRLNYQVQSEHGKWHVQTELKSKIPPVLSQISKPQPTQQTTQAPIVVYGSTLLTQEGASQWNGTKITLPQPVTIHHEISLGQNETQVDLTAQIPSLKMTQLPPITGFQTHLIATRSGENRFTLKELSANLNHSTVKLSAEATGDTKTQDYQTQGSLVVDVPQPFPLLTGQTIEGHFELPWSLAIYHGQQIHFEGLLNILNLSWSKSPTRKSPSSAKVEGISGKIPLNEQLIWNGESLKFAQLISQNPFERVDFERIQPMIHESEQLFVKMMGFEEKTYGPLQGFFSLRQNMLYAHQFDLKLGSGKTYGEMYLDTNPSNVQFGILARMTGLDLVEILPQLYRPQHYRPQHDRNQAGHGSSQDKAPVEIERVSGRSGMVVNLNNGSINGRIDVTEIGKQQLLTLINLVDPRYENLKMNRARFALKIAHPSFIQMSFQQGYMDMLFKLQGALNQDFEMRGIPISAWVAGAKAEMFKGTKTEIPKGKKAKIFKEAQKGPEL